MWVTIEGFFIDFWSDWRFRAGVIFIVAFVAAWLAEFTFRYGFARLADRTSTDLDDKIIAALRRPLFWSVLFAGTVLALDEHAFSGRHLIYSALKTVAVVLWTIALMSMAAAVLSTVARRAKKYALVQPGTLPVFDMVAKIVLIGLGFYFTFLAWGINVSAWIASAGIVGIAVGFAAQDTLANMISGIVILADGIYKVGDFIVLEKDQKLRGRVTRIGLRSTRIVTLDNIEITVPNADITKSKIVNEVGGDSIRQRMHAAVSVAYGSDVDQVIEVLRGCPEEMEGLCKTPGPVVRFVNFGGSGLEFELLVWIQRPEDRDNLHSILNVRIYKALGAAGIEIPYSKHDVYIKQMPGMGDEPEGDGEELEEEMAFAGARELVGGAREDAQGDGETPGTGAAAGSGRGPGAPG